MPLNSNDFMNAEVVIASVYEKLKDYLETRVSVPSYMHDGLLKYYIDGIEPGDFLEAVIKNDFVTAVCKADENNRTSLRDWGWVMYNEIPTVARYQEGYDFWIQIGGYRGFITKEIEKLDKEE